MKPTPHQIICRLMRWLAEAREAAKTERLKRELVESERDQLLAQIEHFSKELMSSSRRWQALVLYGSANRHEKEE